MIGRVLPHVLVVAATFIAFPAVASCDRVEGHIRVMATSCDYASSVEESCYEGNMYGYAHLSIGHSISEDSYGIGSEVYSNTWDSEGYNVEDGTSWPGFPRECFSTDASYFIADTETFRVYLDTTSSMCGCLDGCNTYRVVSRGLPRLRLIPTIDEGRRNAGFSPTRADAVCENDAGS